jgi:hypothetical protein
MDYLFVLLTGLVMFLLGQSIQAVSIAALLNLLSKRFRSKRRVQAEGNLLGEFMVLSITLFSLFINSLFQIGVWALAFFLGGQFDNYPDAFYHSAVNFATLGYGDIVMASPWRLLGALEAISGILMLGLSTATLSFVFGQLMRLHYVGLRKQLPDLP